MMTLLFDQAATHFSQDYHQERPARLINTEAYLLDKRPDWVWMKPRLASEKEVLRAHRPKHLERLLQPVDFDADTPTIRALKNTPGVPPERPSVQSIWPSAGRKLSR